MKKLLLILLFFPMISFGQDVVGFNKCDIIINQLLENTANYIKEKNITKKEYEFYLKNQKLSINWNNERFYKWQIIDNKIQKKENEQ